MRGVNCGLAIVVEVSASAFALGVVGGSNVFANGEIFKIPLELFAGLGFHALRQCPLRPP